MICTDAIARFVAGDVPPGEFGHTRHVEMAHAMLRRAPFTETAADYARGIRRMAERAGRPEAFHATITVAFLALVGERLAAGGGDSFGAFARINSDLFERDILTRHYSDGRLRSDAARTTFLLPDVIP